MYSIMEEEHGDLLATYPTLEEARRALADAIAREPESRICIISVDRVPPITE